MNKPNLIVIPDDSPAVMAPSEAFRKLGNYDVCLYDTRPSSAGALIERIREARVVINIRSSCRFDREVFDAVPGLRIISIWGTGTDNVDLNSAVEHDICVTNTPGVSVNTVAEHTLMLMLAASRRIVDVDRRVRKGEWPRSLITQLHGKTLGVIGLGAIGRRVAKLALGIGMNVIAWTLNPSEEVAMKIPLTLVEFEEVFKESDVVTVHVRHSVTTDRFINANHFELMKPNALFINTARGKIVDEQALLDHLKRGLIGGAGLDVFSSEPMAVTSPFFKLSNVVMSPHSAGISPEAIELGLEMAIDNVLAFLKGEPINVVV